MKLLRSTILFVSIFTAATAAGQTTTAVPSRQIPPSVLAELRLLENRFELALAGDCAPERCFSKGCTYVAHEVADRPRAGSLPGLGQDPGPGSVPAQEYLTRARCSFAHEKSVNGRDVRALVRRLQAKLSKAWTVVTVDHEVLESIPRYLRDSPEPPTPEPVAEPEPEPPPQVIEPEAWTLAVAARELWTALLPHFFWMIALVMVTLAALTMIWAWRRVGRESPEEQALMAQLASGEPAGQATEPEETVASQLEAEAAAPSDDDDATYVEEQAAAWRERLATEDPDPALQALTRELLRSGELPLLAKAVFSFPENLPRAFPSDGDFASAKLELADYLKSVDPETLPSDAELFAALNRHALSAALASQTDARAMRSLREEFGAAGLTQLAGSLPPRPGALLFALAPLDEQHEMARLLSPRQITGAAHELLRSNRMDRNETAYLFAVLEAVRRDAALPPVPELEVSDRGVEYDAASALSVLLARVDPDERAALFGASLERFHGSLPTWYRGILFADMLLELTPEARADLLLEVDIEGLAAWLSLLATETNERVLDGLPAASRAAIRAASAFPSRARQLALASRGRQELAAAFQRQLARANVPFERVLDIRGARSGG
jgi:hypothetical protein